MKDNRTQNWILKGIAVSALASICAGILIGQSRGPDWARMRTAATAILGWKVVAPVSLQEGAFLESLDKYNPLFVRNIEGSSAQTVSTEIPKKLDYRLTPDGVTAIQS